MLRGAQIWNIRLDVLPVLSTSLSYVCACAHKAVHTHVNNTFVKACCGT